VDIAISRNGVPIRLTAERWHHIIESHSEMAGYYFEVLETIENPDAIYEGRMGECIAIRKLKNDKYVVVIYKEINKKDGFIITAFITKKKKQFEKRRIIWKK